MSEQQNHVKEMFLNQFLKYLKLDKPEYLNYIENTEYIIEDKNPIDFSSGLLVTICISLSIRGNIIECKHQFDTKYLLIQHIDIITYMDTVNKSMANMFSIKINKLIPDVIKEEYFNKLDKELPNKEDKIKKVKI